MKNFEGYLKRKFGDSYVLLAGGGQHELVKFAFRNTWNDLLNNTNEFTFASSQYSGAIWMNYRTASGSADGAITQYLFGDGAGSYADVIAKGFKINGADDTSVVLAGGSTKSLKDFMLNSPYHYPNNMPALDEPSSSYFGSDANYNYVNAIFSEGWPNSWSYANILNFTGYAQWGGTQLAVQYCTDTPGISLRTWYYPLTRWGSWITIITSSNIASLTVASATTATKLTTVSKNIWGLTYWTSDGVPLNIDIDKVAKMPYILFKNYNDNNAAGYCGRGASNNNSIQLSAYSGNVLYIGANNATGMTFDTSNNVGIGTTSPSSKLHVVGAIKGSTTLTIGSRGTDTGTGFYTGDDTNGLYIEGHGKVGFRILYAKTITNGSPSNYDSLLMKNGSLTFNGYTIWHSNNDGSTSGLDADLLDGNHASAFATSSHTHTYITTPYPYTGRSTYNIEGESITDSATSPNLAKNSLGSLFPAFHYTDWGWSDTLYWSGYSHWGGTELATLYNVKNNIRVKIRKWSLTNGGEWSDWTEFITSGNISSQSVDSLTTTSKTVFGLTYWDANGKPVSVLGTAVGTMRYLYFRNKDDNGNAGYVGRGGSSNEIQFCGYTGNAVDIGANNKGGHIHIDTNGYVGIGTVSPSYKLDVEGLIGINSNNCHAYIGAANTSWFHIETNGRQIYISSSTDLNGSLAPYVTNSYNLGGSSKYWNYLYCNYINGSNTFIHSGNIGNQHVKSAEYLVSDYYYDVEVPTSSSHSIDDSRTASELCKNLHSILFPAFHRDSNAGWWDDIFFSGYNVYGSTLLSLLYNVRNKGRAKFRTYNQSVSGWGDWTEFITSGNIGSQSVASAASADKLSNVTSIFGVSWDGSSNIGKTTTPYTRYLFFTGTDNSTAIGYIGKGSGSSDQLQLCTYTNASILLDAGTNNVLCTGASLKVNGTKVSLEGHTHGWLSSDYYYSGNTISDSTTSDSLCKSYNGTILVAFHNTDWGWSDTLYWSGYDKWGGTELATCYNAASNVRVKIRKFTQTGMKWGDWTEFITNAGGQTINGNLTATNFYTTSDQRKKANIIPISESICSFTLKDTNTKSYGFIAQELEKTNPELVDSSGEYKTVNYNGAICLVIAKLENKNALLETRIKELENEVTLLRKGGKYETI